MFNKVVFIACLVVGFAAIIFQFFLPEVDKIDVNQITTNILAKLKEPLAQYSSDNAKVKRKEGGKSSKILTVDELARYNGEEGSDGLYLALIGKVYDVSKGSQHYGPGGGYHGFAGNYLIMHQSLNVFIEGRVYEGKFSLGNQ